jgi:hypothetical protein
MNIERATLFDRSVKVPLMTRVPLMKQVHRETKLLMLERNLRMDELRDLIRRHAGDPRYFNSVSKWRREMIDLYEQF